MKKNLRYDYIKKNSVDFIFFSTPWSKQGAGSFNSKVSVNLIRNTKRSLNGKFFNLQDNFLHRLINFYFLRYNDDFSRISRYPLKALWLDFKVLLRLNVHQPKVGNKNFLKLLSVIHNLNPYMSEIYFYSFNKLCFSFYQIINATCNSQFFFSNSSDAKINRSFLRFGGGREIKVVNSNSSLKSSFKF